MKRWKEILMLILTAAIILLCGRFPELLTKGKKEDGLHYREVSQIDYDLSVQQAGLSYEEKVLLIDRSWISGREADAVLTPEQVHRAAYDGLKPYAEHNLIPVDYETFDFSCQNYLCYDPDEPEVNNPIWNITMSLFSDNSDVPTTIGMVIDDATGAVLQVRFHAANIFGDRMISAEVGVLSSVYLNGIPVVIQTLHSLTDEGNAIQAYGLYPKGTIEFLLHRDGFEIKIDADANWMQ